MKPYALIGVVRAYIFTGRGGGLNFLVREVGRLIPVLIGSAALCACGDDLTLSPTSYIASAGSTQNSSSGATTPTTPSGAFVGINVLVSGLDSGASLHFSLNGSAVSSGVIDANGDTPVPGNVTELMVGSAYSFAITVQPQDEICAAANASGTIGSAIPPNITITCVARGASSSIVAASATSLGIKSTPSHATPQARQGAASWTDPNGRLWMFGGNGYDAEGASETFGDLWRLSPVSSGWTLITASSSTPAARAYAASWADANGDLWLFGGQGRDTNGTAPPTLSMICGSSPYRPANGPESAARHGKTCQAFTDSQVFPSATTSPAAGRTPSPGSIQPARSGSLAATASTRPAHWERSTICGSSHPLRTYGPG
jgi:hypothetical protein